MRKIYLLMLLSVVFSDIQSQSFNWAKREGLYAYDYGYGIANDNSGNVYVAGKYEQYANFSGIILPNQGNGNHDIFLAKYNANGNIAWVSTGGGGLGDYAHALACNGTGLFLAGEIEYYAPNNVIVFPGSPITLIPYGSNDGVLTKYDLNGNLLWARKMGGYYNDKAQAVTYDNAGNVYVSGFFTDTAFFGSTTIYGKGNQDIFIAKYDMNGVFQWVRNAGGTGRDEAKSMKCDAAGNVYVCGMFNNGAMFGAQTYTCSNYAETFLAKYSSTGVLLWVKTGGGAYDDVAWGVTIDNAGKIYMTGEFNASANFGSTQLITSGNADIFVNCYDASGNVQWAKRAGGAFIDRARGIGCDGTNIFITGQFGFAASFGAANLTAPDSSDIFFASVDNTGNFMRAASVGGAPDSVETLGYESGIAICGEASGNVYATGALLNGGVFGTTVLTAYSRTDIFVTKISQLTGVNEPASPYAQSANIYPNPTNGNLIIDLDRPANQKTEMSISNCLGQVINKWTEINSKINIDLTEQQSGIYFVELKQEGKSVLREKIIIQK